MNSIAESTIPVTAFLPENHLQQKIKKRKTIATDSCVRTDLLQLAPNAGKSQALETLFNHYRPLARASVEIAESSGKRPWTTQKVKVWRIISPGNPLHASSVLMQPAIAKCKGPWLRIWAGCKKIFKS